MSCTAINMLTGERVEIPPGKDARTIWTGDELRQMAHPITREPVTPVRPVMTEEGGEVMRRSHWRHKKRSDGSPILWPEDIAFDREYGYEKDGKRLAGGESPEHRFGKFYVRDLLLAEFAAHGKSYRVGLEEHLPINRSKKYRVADICVFDGDTPLEVHEIQLSNITPEDIAERTADYESFGLPSPIWYLGSNVANAESVRLALSEYTSEYVLINIEKKERSRFYEAGEMFLSSLV